MERPIKGGYILISLGLVALSAGASLTIDYERITKTKKHIVLTGIKVADTIMPDITVKPIFGNGTITFSDVYGYDIVVSSNNSVSVSEHETEDIPNVEEAPSGTIVESLGLDEDGKVVKGEAPSGGATLYKHSVSALHSSGNVSFVFLSISSTPLTLENAEEEKTKSLINGMYGSNGGIAVSANVQTGNFYMYDIAKAGLSLRVFENTIGGTNTSYEIISISDTVTEF